MSSDNAALKLCKDCGQPMLPPGVVKLPNEYDHAQGCPSDNAAPILSREERIKLAQQRAPKNDIEARECMVLGYTVQVNADMLEMLLEEIQRLTEERDAEKLRADGNFASLERVKGKYSEATAELSALRAELEAVKQKAGRCRDALAKIANDDWAFGGRVIHGNDKLPGRDGEFYKAWNSGIDAQFHKTKKIADAAISQTAQPEEKR